MPENKQQELTNSITWNFKHNPSLEINLETLSAKISIESGQSIKRVKKLVTVLINGEYLKQDDETVSIGSVLLHELEEERIERERESQLREQQQLEYENKKRAALLRTEQESQLSKELERKSMIEKQEKENQRIETGKKLSEDYKLFVDKVKPVLFQEHGIMTKESPDHWNNFSCYWCDESRINNFMNQFKDYPNSFWIKLLNESKVRLMCDRTGSYSIDQLFTHKH